MTHFNEHALEMAIMELFEQEGYIYTNGEQVHKELNDVLLRDDLRMYLSSRYAKEGLTMLEQESAIAKLTANVGNSLYENNVYTYRLITEGFAIRREDTSKADLFIEPIDFATESNNIFRIVNQLEVKGYEKRIPDAIVYINGLPMVVLEFKSAVKEETTIMDAFTQLTVRYRRDIPELFKYNAFVVISDGVNNKYGSLFTPYEFFYSWQKIEADDKPTDGVSSLLTMVHGLFRKERLLSVIKDFVFLPDSSTKEQKIVCRYPQFFATHKLFGNIYRHSKLNADGDGKGGTYFGATGCGKSFTMLFLTRMLMRSKEFANPTIILITDRVDLDAQLSEQFGKAKIFIGDDCVVAVESRSKLREHLSNRTSGGVFLTTIHKFTEDTQLLSERANIICISDEAHRSQTNLSLQVKQTDKGVRRSYGFAKYLHDSLPNATYVGFTGTPIDSTIDVFGKVVDAYTMTESVADDITRRIVYEGRAAKVLLDNAKLEDIQGVLKNSNGKINIIKGTDWITLPELFAIDAELLEGNNKLRGRNKRDELLTSCLDVKCFEQNGDTYYFVGEIGEGMRNSISHSTNIRQIVRYKDAPDFFEQLLPLMSVSFVKNGQLTVIPFPYKYLREYIKTVK